MTVHLPDDLEQFVRDAVRDGHYAGEDDLIRDALTRLREAMPEVPATCARAAKAGHAKPTATVQSPLTPEELNRRLIASGLVTRLPDPSLDVDDDDEPPIEIEGEPLSETILRERR